MFPVNETLKKKWIEVIGHENINPRHKIWYICSMHFDENCFNRTLDVTRLRDGTVPSSYLLPNQICLKYDEQNPRTTYQQDATSSSAAMPLSLSVNNEQNQIKSISSLQQSTSALIPDATQETIKRLNLKCKNYKKKIKALNEKVRRQRRKIVDFSIIVKDLQKLHLVNTKNVIALEECAGPKDFLKRQIAKSKGESPQRKYSEELRKFSVTLHFLSPKAYEFVRREYNLLDRA